MTRRPGVAGPSLTPAFMASDLLPAVPASVLRPLRGPPAHPRTHPGECESTSACPACPPHAACSAWAGNRTSSATNAIRINSAAPSDEMEGAHERLDRFRLNARRPLWVQRTRGDGPAGDFVRPADGIGHRTLQCLRSSVIPGASRIVWCRRSRPPRHSTARPEPQPPAVRCSCTAEPAPAFSGEPRGSSGGRRRDHRFRGRIPGRTTSPAGSRLGVSAAGTRTKAKTLPASTEAETDHLARAEPLDHLCTARSGQQLPDGHRQSEGTCLQRAVSANQLHVERQEQQRAGHGRERQRHGGQ